MGPGEPHLSSGRPLSGAVVAAPSLAAEPARLCLGLASRLGLESVPLGLSGPSRFEPLSPGLGLGLGLRLGLGLGFGFGLGLGLGLGLGSRARARVRVKG